MQLTDLDFSYPEELVATERNPVSRVMLVQKTKPKEISLNELLALFAPGDLLVINDTQVLKRRVFSQEGLEILFLKAQNSGREWQVLCPSSRWKKETLQTLPGGVQLELLERGKPQRVRASQDLNEKYFSQYGEMPLPPYIQKARGDRHNRVKDNLDYQTAWAQKPGSLAAPTASLHFTQEQLAQLKARGVGVEKVTLHVGLGTFLPITTERLDDHEMHFEWSEIPAPTWQAVQDTKAQKGRVWALGTTVTRTLESVAQNLLKPQQGGGWLGETNLFIRPGFEYKVVDVLMTNFHQPQSTLLALVAAFSNLNTVKTCYGWAIQHKFRLFSYGDLSVWIK
jgi:S-adenosylmethionine:tRNA ribosyltransferase-isomerase